MRHSLLHSFHPTTGSFSLGSGVILPHELSTLAELSSWTQHWSIYHENYQPYLRAHQATERFYSYLRNLPSPDSIDNSDYPDLDNRDNISAIPSVLTEKSSAEEIPLGWIESQDSSENPLIDLAFYTETISSELWSILTAISHPLTLTAWNTIHIHHCQEEEAEVIIKVLAPRGYIFDRNLLPDSAWETYRGALRHKNLGT